MIVSGEGATAIPAIVIGREQTGLGTLRSLCMAGIPAYVACPPGDLICRSRWYRPVPGNVRWDGGIGPHAREILQSVPLERAVVVPARDDAVLWASELPQGPLRDRFRVSGSSRAKLEILLDKSRFGEFLATLGIPHPRSFTIHSSADIAAIPFDELDRVFIKPADSQKFQRLLGVKGLWALNRAEFEVIWQKLEIRNLAAIAQEYVPGNPDQHYFIDGFRDRDGRLVGLFARRRLRIYPCDFGNSSYCESIALQEIGVALENLTVLLAALDYRGIFSAEFKRDARDGAFRVLEVNARPWWYVEFAARCGVNVVEMAYRDALGLPVRRRSTTYVVGAGCVNLRDDLNAVFRYGKVPQTPLTLALRQWTRGYFNVFRCDDPLPGLQIAWRELSTKTFNCLRRIFRSRNLGRRDTD